MAKKSNLPRSNSYHAFNRWWEPGAGKLLDGEVFDEKTRKQFAGFAFHAGYTARQKEIKKGKK